MAGIRVRCCGYPGKRSKSWPESCRTWRKSLHSLRRYSSISWPCNASRTGLEEDRSRSLGACTPCAWRVAKVNRGSDSEYLGWWDDAVKDNCALQSGLLRRVSEEVATLNGQPAVCMFFDKEKFYDSACLHKLIDQAIARNISTRLLYIAMQACLSERIPRAEEMVGQSIQHSNGILAGCSLGNRFARVILYSILDSVNNELLA